MTIDMNRAIVVAQASEEQHPWGVWQFPSITRLGDNLLEAAFSRTMDSASLDSAKKRHAPVAYSSTDNGVTWREAARAHGERNTCTLRNGDVIRLEKTPEKDVLKAELPEGTPWEHGYNGEYTIRDPRQMPAELTRQFLMRKPAGRDEWERIPATIDDPDGGKTWTARKNSGRSASCRNCSHSITGLLYWPSAAPSKPAPAVTPAWLRTALTVFSSPTISSIIPTRKGIRARRY